MFPLSDKENIKYTSTHVQVCGSNGSAASLGTKRWAGVIPEVNLRNPLHAGDEASKQGIYPNFQTQSRHQWKYKIGISVASQKGLMSSKDFWKKKH